MRSEDAWQLQDPGSAAVSGLFTSLSGRKRKNAEAWVLVLTGLGGFMGVPALLRVSDFPSVTWDLCPESLKRALH